MCTQNNFPHMFQQLPGEVFKPHDSYGSLSLCHFSGLAKEQRQQSTEPSEVTCQTRQEEEEEEIAEQYCARLYSTQKSSNVWKADFVVTKDLETCTAVSDNTCIKVGRYIVTQ